jgi:hypothetical protein
MVVPVGQFVVKIVDGGATHSRILSSLLLATIPPAQEKKWCEPSGYQQG